MTLGKSVGAALVASILLLVGAGCDKKEGPMERAGKSVDSTMDKVGEKVEKAGEKVGEGVEKAGEKIEKAGENIQEAAKGEKK